MHMHNAYYGKGVCFFLMLFLLLSYFFLHYNQINEYRNQACQRQYNQEIVERERERNEGRQAGCQIVMNE
jgi:penicillin-binding protein-related factor A (putative recombinase)